MDIFVNSKRLKIEKYSFRCAIGRSGLSANKSEGDGTTPIGTFPVRQVFYRADRLTQPICALPVRPIQPTDGWCDDQLDFLYNRLVMLPYTGRHERLWREDQLYDLLTVIGYNDDPVRTGAGSAIFMHISTPDYSPTAGCVAVSLNDLQAVLSNLSVDSKIIISEEF